MLKKRNFWNLQNSDNRFKEKVHMFIELKKALNFNLKVFFKKRKNKRKEKFRVFLKTLFKEKKCRLK